MSDLILAVDQGTTSTRAVLFDGALAPRETAQSELGQRYPRPGWVEHDPREIVRSVVDTVRWCLAGGAVEAKDVAALGIANQRETVVVWNRADGAPIANAIVWQDRRTAEACERLRRNGDEAMLRERTGLLADPYFSATKVAWLLDNVAGARDAARDGRLAFGTIDSWLVWNLTGGKVHATDVTNASRTLLFDIGRCEWDDSLLDLFGIPRAMLPEVRDCDADFGVVEPRLFGAAIPIRGVAGDQQAAMVGQACFEPGMIKSTFGTGAFMLLNVGDAPVPSGNRLLSTVAYRIGGRRAYALEGSVFVAGAAVQWLRDALGLVADAAETADLARSADPSQRVFLVPAFTGLGAPYWNPDARGALFGLTRNAGAAEFARAALESVAFQTRDLVEAMRSDWGVHRAPVALRVDGGMSANDWFLQFLADMMAMPVHRSAIVETTALGAAYIAGQAIGAYATPAERVASWRSAGRFVPRMDAAERDSRYRGWRDAVGRVIAPSDGPAPGDPPTSGDHAGP
jgi:glycerol kinase